MLRNPGQRPISPSTPTAPTRTPSFRVDFGFGFGVVTNNVVPAPSATTVMIEVVPCTLRNVPWPAVNVTFHADPRETEVPAPAAKLLGVSSRPWQRRVSRTEYDPENAWPPLGPGMVSLGS